MNGFWMDSALGGIEMFNEGNDATFVLERAGAGLSLVGEDDLDAGVEKGQFTQTLGKNIERKFGDLKDRAIGLEGRSLL